MLQIKIRNRVLDSDQLLALTKQISDYCDFDMRKFASKISDETLSVSVICWDDLDKYVSQYHCSFRHCAKACIVALSEITADDFPNWKSILKSEHCELEDEMDHDLMRYCDEKEISSLKERVKLMWKWSKACPQSYLDYYGYDNNNSAASAYLYLCSTGEIVSGLSKFRFSLTEEEKELNMQLLLKLNDYIKKPASLSIEELASRVKPDELWNKYQFQTLVVRAYEAAVKEGFILLKSKIENE